MAAMTTTTTGKCLHLPEEVVVEIMTWLPPESLMTFKLVSKSWYNLIQSLISDPTFVSRHLRNMKNDMSLSTSPAFIYQSPCTCEDVGDHLVYVHLISCPVSVPKICSLSRLSDDQIHHVLEDLPRILNERNVIDRLDYHCNGVTVLTRYQSGIFRGSFLCNPSIMEFRLVPEQRDFVHVRITGGGFGYDSRANDYKLVQFGYDWTSNNSEAVVYSLSTNSWRDIKFEWSEIPFDQDFDDIMINGKGVFCKGVIYWHLCIQEVLSLNEILHSKLLSFDVCDEIFRVLTLPDNLQVLGITWYTKWNSLAVWNESLAMFHYPIEREDSKSIEVWVMNECFGSWCKQLVIGPLVGIQKALAFWKRDELVLQGKDGSLVSYNLCSQKLRNLSVDGVGKKHGMFAECVFPYVKSLVSVKGRRQHDD